MKVWGFNCYGVCVRLIEKEKIEEYNRKHPLFSEKIASWKEAVEYRYDYHDYYNDDDDMIDFIDPDYLPTADDVEEMKTWY